jgi:hypothetical protein
MAIHGYLHTDHSQLTLDEQVDFFQRAIDTFSKCQIPFSGFRAPFLRVNESTSQALSRLHFSYNSSQAVLWDVIDPSGYSEYQIKEYERVHEFYGARRAQTCLALPRSNNGLVEIPITMPDDEGLVERLGITDRKTIGEIWRRILEKIYDRGELFTVSLHPERIFICEGPLSDVVQQAKQLDPPVWIATLKEIAAWWQEKQSFTLDIASPSDGKYVVQTSCSPRSTLLVKNCKTNTPARQWYGGWQSIAAGDFVLESPGRPVIGVSQSTAPAAVQFLRSEGYTVETGGPVDRYGLYLDNLEDFTEADEKKLAERVEKTNAPLLRYWRWPDRTRCCLCVTGDIDSITLMDFALRIFENRKQNGM